MIVKDKIYVVTGGCGYLGKELVKRIIEQGGKVRTLSLNNYDCDEMKKKYGDSIFVLVGDVADKQVVQILIAPNTTGVFHLAAYKYVGMAEKETIKCINSNVFGTINVLDVCVENKVDFVICSSTAAAVKVSGVYGATKMLMEKLFHQYQREHSGIKFRVLRYGNILYSTGSVLCKWKDAILNNGKIIITDPDSTRFYTTLSESVDLLFRCLEESTDSKPYIPAIKAVRMGDILDAMITKYAPENHTIVIEKIGLQLGENKHEVLMENGLDSSEVMNFSPEQVIEMI